MDKNLIIEKTKAYVREKLEGEGTGHDWWHIVRVHDCARYIGEIEKADLFIVELAALLHDIADWKFNEDNMHKGEELSREWLQSLAVEEHIINKVTTIIGTMSYKGGTTDATQHTIEGMVVQDADRLDAIGAIGVARAFAYGGFKSRQLYNPEVKPQEFKDFEDYKKSEGTTVNHFYEKLLLLKDLMNTETAKKVAAERHGFMEQFLEQFYREWESKDIR